jgi:hypothetical protein
MQSMAFRGASWSPARRIPPSAAQALGQGASSAAILDNPLLAAGTGFVLASSSAYLAWGLQVRKSGWAVFWWLAATAGTMKMLHDLSRLKT